MNHNRINNVDTATASPVSSDASSPPRASRSNANLGKRNLTFASWNVRSLLGDGNCELLAKSLNERNVHLACLSETRIPNSGNKVISTPNPENARITHPYYKLYFSGPDDGSGQRGVGFALCSSLSNHAMEWHPVSDRLAKLCLATSPFNTTIFSCYAPTNPSDDSIKDNFYSDLGTCIASTPTSDFLIVSGDFNASVGKRLPFESSYLGAHCLATERNDNGDRFTSMLSHHHLVASNTLYRHKKRHLETWASNNGHTRKQIDFICVKQRWKSSVSSCRAYWGTSLQSDHSLLVLSLRVRLSTKSTTHKHPRIAYEKLADAAVRSAFEIQLSNRFDALLNISEDIDSTWNSMKDIILDTSESCIGKSFHARNDWISPHTLSLVERRRNTNRTAQRQALTSEIKEAITNDKEAFWIKQADDMNQATSVGDNRKLFNTLKRAVGKRNTCSEILLETDGSQIRSTQRRYDRWKEHFSELLNRPPPSVPLFENPFDRSLTVVSSDPTLPEVKKSISCMRSQSAPGIDGIPASIWKAGGHSLARRLHELILQIWRTETMPSDWKKSILIPLFKKGDKRKCNNYRGISLLNVAYKILEGIILDRLRPVVDSFLRESQCGFRPGRSTVDQIFALRQIIEQRHEFNEPLLISFVDFKAAFDSIDRSRMYQILLHHGLPQKIVKIIETIYCNSISCVQVNNISTDPFHVDSGVKQGALLSPLLFNLVLDMVLTISLEDSPGVNVGQSEKVTDLDYADDIAILATCPTDMQNCLNRLVTTAATVGLTINPEKTKMMTLNTTPVPIYVNGQQLEDVDHFCYLGHQIKADCSGDLEIRTRIAKAENIFTMLHKPLWSNNHISMETKLKVYFSAVRPVLMYSCETWPVRLEDLRRMQAFEFRCWRRLLKVSYLQRVSNTEVMDRLHIGAHKLCTCELKRRRWNYLGHILRRPSSFIAKVCLLANPDPSWRRPRGGVRMTWQRTILKDLSSLSMHHIYRSWHVDWKNILTDIASDRVQWKQFVDRVMGNAGDPAMAPP